MVYQQWLDQVRELCGDDFSDWNDWYSFRVAYQDGMTPKAAVRDCKKWMRG